MTPTLDRLSAILAKDYKLEVTSIDMNTPLESLGIDSLGVADLLFNVEDEFKISLPPEPVSLVTVGDVTRFIDTLIALQSGGSAQRGAVLPGPGAASAPAGTVPS